MPLAKNTPFHSKIILYKDQIVCCAISRCTSVGKDCLHCTRVFIIFFAYLPGLWTVKKGIQGLLNIDEKTG